MHPDFPIEQLARRRGLAFQFAFATEAKELFQRDEEFVLDVSHRGLRVLARNEEGLARPVAVLRDAYGEGLDLVPPKVRLMEGVQVREPIMHVRISLHRDFREAVKRALRARGATPCEEYVRSTYCVLRYEAPLTELLGLQSELAGITAGSAKHWIALSHYALVKGDPGGTAA